MARKWAVTPHEAEIVRVCESNRFESWVSNCPHCLTGISQLLTVPQTNTEGTRLNQLSLQSSALTIQSHPSILF